MELPPDILFEALGFAAMIGAGWWRLAVLENKVDENNALIRKQNSRIGNLEEWRTSKEAYQQGFADARGGSDV